MLIGMMGTGELATCMELVFTVNQLHTVSVGLCGTMAWPKSVRLQWRQCEQEGRDLPSRGGSKTLVAVLTRLANLVARLRGFSVTHTSLQLLSQAPFQERWVWESNFIDGSYISLPWHLRPNFAWCNRYLMGCVTLNIGGWLVEKQWFVAD